MIPLVIRYNLKTLLFKQYQNVITSILNMSIFNFKKTKQICMWYYYPIVLIFEHSNSVWLIMT